ncbi:alpha/beta-hydrolase, partial [Rhizophagus irregularis]
MYQLTEDDLVNSQHIYQEMQDHMSQFVPEIIFVEDITHSLRQVPLIIYFIRSKINSNPLGGKRMKQNDNEQFTVAGTNIDEVKKLNAQSGLSYNEHFEQFPDDRTNGIHFYSPPNERRPDVFQIEEQKINIASLHLSMKIYTPKDMSHYSLLVFLNGGEIISGDWESSDIACRMLASFSGYKVISIDYKPLLKKSVSSTFDGCYNAIKWITSNAQKFGGNPDNVSICGDSIGATLATSIIIQSIKTNDFILSNQLLFYPIIDFTNEVEKSEYLSRKMYNAKYG